MRHLRRYGRVITTNHPTTIYRGSGFGSLLRGLFRMGKPLIASAAKAALPVVKKTVKNASRIAASEIGATLADGGDFSTARKNIQKRVLGDIKQKAGNYLRKTAGEQRKPARAKQKKGKVKPKAKKKTTVKRKRVATRVNLA